MQLLRVTDRKSRLYDEAIAILQGAIAREAQIPEQQFPDLLAAGQYQLFAYRNDEDVHGFALVYFSGQFRFAWLDYFGIRSDLRGRGLGSALFREIVQSASKQGPRLDWLLFEVDDDYEGDAQREADCIRRVRFYRRLGARVLENVSYKFPSAFVEPIRMRLMAYQLHANARLAPDDLKHAVGEIFTNIHGRGVDDKLLRWFEAGLPEALDLK
jgi:GNAT superfamily N-acetyltransferase